MTDDDIRDLLSDLGPVTIRRMFGGRGIYHAGLIVAVELDGEVLLKADAASAPAFEAAGARRCVYTRPGRKPMAMPYWSIPDDAIDDIEEMGRWARLAYEAALRTRG
jgi:DNA transformation protein and related proteins